MNYLMHIHTAGDDAESLVGNMMGDFVKGRLDSTYPPAVREGICLHREVDSFAANNPFFLRSKRRIDDSFGHFKGVLVDIFYDHFLAANWGRYSPEPFEDFVEKAYRVLSEYRELMPDSLKRLLPRMFSSNWLLSYRRTDGIDSVLKRMSLRISRPNRVGDGLSQLELNYIQLQEDFFRFMADLEQYLRARRSR